MTKKLFHENPYQTAFSATVQAQTKTDKGWEVTLDQTCFYPAGGGQAADTGTLNGIPVISLYKTANQEIVHILHQQIETTTVTGIIDWNRRFSHMQQHSGQHVLSAVLFTHFATQTIQAKFDAQEGYILIDRFLSDEELQQGVAAANQTVFENREIVTKNISIDEMTQFPLVKAPKEKFSATGTIRIWHIPDFYTIPCGGTHVKRTGEIGLLYVIKQLKEGTLTKLFFTTGTVTLAYLEQLQATEISLARILSSSMQDITTSATKYMEQLAILEKQASEQQKQLAIYKTADIAKNAQKIGVMTVYLFPYAATEQTMTRPLLQQLVISQESIAIATNPKLPLMIACSRTFSFEILPELKDLLVAYHGKGGGNLISWQAMIPDQQGFVKELLLKLHASSDAH